ncbi:MAG TPA: Sjogren's syndrome/scleroderma autoantigen 1 family protein [Candidatus Bathyarchaeia archaeon]|nr:Sjogren's syndrome/scleroderma autoantigen 1 family protein [Candidatus Bathyarchaeia archaeon]
MSKDLTKKAVEMLLNGATLVSDPCPYCKGVRIIKEGNAFCVNCGREANEKKVLEVEHKLKDDKNAHSPVDRLDKKLKDLTNELYHEKNHEKQQQIIRSINEIISIKERLKTL